LADSDAERDRLAAARARLDHRYQADIRRLLIQLDRSRGEIEAARSAHAESSEQAHALCTAAAKLSEALNETAEELARVDHHRQRLIEDINAIGSSQSWRLGYALTWPARALRRSPRRGGAAAAESA
jgi:septal ring factor EnvC (AmiA/AmiB activator)